VTIPKIAPAMIEDAIDRLAANEVLTSPALISPLVEKLPAGQQRFQDRVNFRLAGTIVPAELLARFQSRLGSNVLSEYGATEVGAITAGVHGQVGRPTGSAGYLIPWVEAQAVDDEGRPLPAGGTGRLRFRSESFPSGYLDDPELSAKVFRDGWFYPGDVGRVMPDASLEVDTRDDDLLNLDGMKVNPTEVEAALLEDPNIADAAAYAVDTSRGTKMLLAAIVCRGPVDDVSTLQRLTARLGAKAPRRLVRLKALPRGDSGKLLRQQLVDRTRVAPASEK
jgi:acyl-coenzyme A synthetase/AMP-(fatty) acid ligase